MSKQPSTRDDVLVVIRQTAANGPGEYRLPDFLASIDWSDTLRPPPEVADVLGRLELWDSEYREGDIDWPELAARLGALSEGIAAG